MARMNATEFMKFCNDRLPDNLRRIIKSDLEVWRGELQPEKILEGVFYYERHYWSILKLLYAEKAEAERPQRELAKNKKQEAQKQKKQAITKAWHKEHPDYLSSWEEAHPESKKERNRRYNLRRKQRK